MDNSKLDKSVMNESSQAPTGKTTKVSAVQVSKLTLFRKK